MDSSTEFIPSEVEGVGMTRVFGRNDNKIIIQHSKNVKEIKKSQKPQ